MNKFSNSKIEIGMAENLHVQLFSENEPLMKFRGAGRGL